MRKPSRLVIEEVALELGGGGEGDGVDEDVELAVLLFERGEEGVDLGVVGDVALEAGGAGKFGDEAFGFVLHALVLVADGQGCAGFVEFLGDAPGDGTLVGQPEDHGRLTRQIDHSFFFLRCRCSVQGSAGSTVFENTSRQSAAQVDEFDLADGAFQKAGPKALEFLDRVGGEAADQRCGGHWRIDFCALPPLIRL